MVLKQVLVGGRRVVVDFPPDATLAELQTHLAERFRKPGLAIGEGPEADGSALWWVETGATEPGPASEKPITTRERAAAKDAFRNWVKRKPLEDQCLWQTRAAQDISTSVSTREPGLVHFGMETRIQGFNARRSAKHMVGQTGWQRREQRKTSFRAMLRGMTHPAKLRQVDGMHMYRTEIPGTPPQTCVVVRYHDGAARKQYGLAIAAGVAGGIVPQVLTTDDAALGIVFADCTGPSLADIAAAHGRLTRRHLSDLEAVFTKAAAAGLFIHSGGALGDFRYCSLDGSLRYWVPVHFRQLGNMQPATAVLGMLVQPWEPFAVRAQLEAFVQARRGGGAVGPLQARLLAIDTALDASTTADHCAGKKRPQ